MCVYRGVCVCVRTSMNVCVYGGHILVYRELKKNCLVTQNKLLLWTWLAGDLEVEIAAWQFSFFIVLDI